jgi:hypothetical protein
VMSNIFLIIRGNAAVPSGQNRRFSNFKPLTKGIADAQPDYFNGSRPEEVDFRFRTDLRGYIVPSKRRQTPLIPNFSMEMTGSSITVAVLKRYVLQNLAYGARGMLEMQSYGQESRNYDGNAYTISAIYVCGIGTLQLYAMHPTPPKEATGPPEYHMTHISSWSLTGSLDSFRQGVAAFRNLQSWAQEQRHEAIARANERARFMYGEPEATALAATASASRATENPAVESGNSDAGACKSPNEEPTRTEASTASKVACPEPEALTNGPLVDDDRPAKRLRLRD